MQRDLLGIKCTHIAYGQLSWSLRSFHLVIHVGKQFLSIKEEPENCISNTAGEWHPTLRRGFGLGQPKQHTHCTGAFNIELHGTSKSFCAGETGEAQVQQGRPVLSCHGPQKDVFGHFFQPYFLHLPVSLNRIYNTLDFFFPPNLAVRMSGPAYGYNTIYSERNVGQKLCNALGERTELFLDLV